MDVERDARLAEGLEGITRHLGEIERRLDRIERLSHGARGTYVGNNRVLVKVVVADDVLAFLVPADDLLLTPHFVVHGIFEHHLTSFFAREMGHGATCLDVGSNFGYFAGLMARLSRTGQVIGIEPDRRMWEMVRDNLSINGLDNARALHAAAGATAGELTLYRRSTRSGNTSIVAADDTFTELMGEKPVERFTVPCVRIDDVVEQFGGRLDFMKVDVEGAEPLVFQGARRTIADNPQLAIVMEWSPGQIVAAGFDLGTFLRSLADLGLRANDMLHDRLHPVSFDELQNLPYRAGVVLRR